MVSSVKRRLTAAQRSDGGACARSEHRSALIDDRSARRLQRLRFSARLAVPAMIASIIPRPLAATAAAADDDDDDVWPLNEGNRKGTRVKEKNETQTAYDDGLIRKRRRVRDK